MSFAEKYNKGESKFNIKTDDFEFFSRRDMFAMKGSEPILLCGLWINEKKTEAELKKYGPSVTAILNDRFMDLPGHMLDTVREILNDPEGIQDINDHKVGISLYEYKNEYFDEKEPVGKKNQPTAIGVKFVDLVD